MSEPLLSDLAFVRAERDGGLLAITIERPEVLNALHPPAHDELDRIFSAFAIDAQLRVAIVTGSGSRSFCAGNDLKALAEAGRDTFPASGFAGITRRFDLRKPVIAAVNGLCLGGGLEMVLAMDIAIAADHAEFGLPEPLVGAAALGGGGLQRLARQIGLKDAMWLALRAKRVTAAEALRMGLINDVVPFGELQARARNVAQDILACAPLSIEATKQVLLLSMDEPDLSSAFDRVYPAAKRMLESDDAREGPLAFAQKRKPAWQGR